MALSNYKHWLWETTGVYSCSVGAADLPTSAGAGAFNVGDIAINLAVATGQPWGWVLTGATGSPVATLTWQAIAVAGPTASRTAAAPTTAASTDNILYVSTAGAVTLPAATAFPINTLITIVNKAASPITVTPAAGNIAGAAASTVAANGHIAAVSDGTNYWIVA